MVETIAKLGPVVQIAYVPVDFEATLRYWTEVMGVGPFFIRERVTYETLKSYAIDTSIDMTIAMGYWGEMQIELIRQNDQTPSIYHDPGKALHDGVHHFCIGTQDIVGARQSIERAGGTIVQEGSAPGGIKFFYADTGQAGGILTEVIALTPQAERWYEVMKQTAREWDGTDPLRDMIKR